MRKKLPFWMIPYYWGLSGKTKEIAKINYYYSGHEADIKCAELTYLTEYEIDKAKNKINKKYNKISDIEFDLEENNIDLNHDIIDSLSHKKNEIQINFNHKAINEQKYEEQMIDLIEDEDEQLLAAIEFSFKYHNITESEYRKSLATLNKEPWIDFNVEYNKQTNEVELSFDYNEHFINKLKNEGHPGSDDDEIIDNYIRDWGRKMVNEEYKEDYDSIITSSPEVIDEKDSLYKNYKMYK